MKAKITVKTPKKQAERSIKTMKDSLVGFKRARFNILDEKLVSDQEFYYIVDCKDQSDFLELIKRGAKAESQIKRFYSTLIKWIDRANKLANKFNKGFEWIRRWIIKQAKKIYQDPNDQDGFITQLNEMSDDDLKEFLKINDRESMTKLLSGELITVDLIEE